MRPLPRDPHPELPTPVHCPRAVERLPSCRPWSLMVQPGRSAASAPQPRMHSSPNAVSAAAIEGPSRRTRWRDRTRSIGRQSKTGRPGSPRRMVEGGRSESGCDRAGHPEAAAGLVIDRASDGRPCILPGAAGAVATRDGVRRGAAHESDACRGGAVRPAEWNRFAAAAVGRSSLTTSPADPSRRRRPSENSAAIAPSRFAPRDRPPSVGPMAAKAGARRSARRQAVPGTPVSRHCPVRRCPPSSRFGPAFLPSQSRCPAFRPMGRRHVLRSPPSPAKAGPHDCINHNWDTDNRRRACGRIPVRPS